MVDWNKIGVDDILSSKGTLMKEFASMQRRIVELEAVLLDLAGDDLYRKNMSDWHDVSKMEIGIRKIAKDALNVQNSKNR